MIFFSMIGSRMPYANLFTRMKSPTSSVGRIEELGILNGSATKERRRNTISRTGKKLFGYSTHHGSGVPGARLRAKNSRSASVMTPVSRVSKKRIRAKFIGSCWWFIGAWIACFALTGAHQHRDADTGTGRQVF